MLPGSDEIEERKKVNPHKINEVPVQTRVVYGGEVSCGEVTSRGSHQQPDENADSADDVQGVVIDLRGNSGGLLDAAVDVCDLLVGEGVIVSTRAADGGLVPREATAGRLLPDTPLVVLVDGLTASAAEIVAACLQDSGRATIVGSRSYGKGTVQSLLPLSDGSATLKLTTAEYLRPSMNPIHRDADDDIAATSPSSTLSGVSLATTIPS